MAKTFKICFSNPDIDKVVTCNPAELRMLVASAFFCGALAITHSNSSNLFEMIPVENNNIHISTDSKKVIRYIMSQLEPYGITLFEIKS